MTAVARNVTSSPTLPQGTETTTEGAPCSKRLILFLIVVIQLLVILALQWRYGGQTQLFFWPTAISSVGDAPINFLGQHVDIQFEHPTPEYTWEGTEEIQSIINPRRIAIGLAITSTRLHNVKRLEKWPFFDQLMPSFCKTASEGFSYHFFLAYDYVDKYFTNKKLQREFADRFKDYSRSNCPGLSNYTLHFIQCNHKGKPANAQNDAMIAAYMLNMGYYYRINDDTVMQTTRWTEIFIEALHKFDPVNVGVVGPNHKGGNIAILTYDFVSNHHVNIFGCYYPHVFTDWFGDSWISKVYLPGRVTKVSTLMLSVIG